MHRLRTTDDRGLAYMVLLFGGTFVIVALLLAVFDPVFSDVLGTATDHADSSQANTGIGYLQDAWSLIPLFTGLLGTVMILAGAAAEARGI